MPVRTLGGATIEKVEEICGPGFKPARMFPKFDQQAFDAQKGWMVPDHVEAESDRLIGSIHSWIVKTPRHTILIDTCLGNHKQRTNPGWRNLDTPFLNRLKACGCPPESVDFVMCTHLHVDHVGWNTRLVDGRWTPTFPNARHLFSAKEYAYFTDPENLTERNRTSFQVQADSVTPIVAAGLAERIEVDGREVIPGFSFHPTPGHSVDHASIVLHSAGAWALFAGDVVHHPVQVHQPNLLSVFDAERDRTLASRRWALDFAADRKATMFSSHFPAPSAGTVTRSGDAYAWRFV